MELGTRLGRGSVRAAALAATCAVMLALLAALAVVLARPVAAGAAADGEPLPPVCVGDTSLAGPGAVAIVIRCGVRPGAVRFEVETESGVHLARVPPRATASGPGATGSFRCHRAPRGAACSGHADGPLTVRGKLVVGRTARCERIRVRTDSFISGGKPQGCPGARAPRLQVDWGYFRGFRRESGIEWDVRADRAALDRRIRKAIAAWHRGEPVAKVSYASMGIPLLPFELRRLEFREALLESTANALDAWVPGHAADTYAGYTLDVSGPIVIRVGFTGDQAAQLARFKAESELLAPGRVQGFLVAPRFSEKQLGEYELRIIESDSFRGLITSVGSGEALAKVEVGTQHVAKVKRLLLEMFGTLDPFLVRFEPPGEFL